MDKTHRDRAVWKAVRSCQIGGVAQPETLQISLESERLRHALLTKDSGNVIDNLRIQRLMGINSLQGKMTMETIPSKSDRSMYSCEKYQFFLDAPFEIGNQCCNVMKKSPMHRYAKETGRKPITAQMASESRLRSQQWLNHGCNGFDMKSPISNPMSFWFEADVLQYLYDHDIPINPVYGQIQPDYGAMGQLDGQMRLDDLASEFGVFDLERPILTTTGCKRTGCFACGYGWHREKKNESRVQAIIDFSNPKMADWMLRGGHFREDGLWEPQNGLGYCFVAEWINRHGNLKIWYPNREHYLKQLPEECWRYLE